MSYLVATTTRLLGCRTPCLPTPGPGACRAAGTGPGHGNGLQDWIGLRGFTSLSGCDQRRQRLLSLLDGNAAGRRLLQVSLLEALAACWWARQMVESTFAAQLIRPFESASAWRPDPRRGRRPYRDHHRPRRVGEDRNRRTQGRGPDHCEGHRRRQPVPRADPGQGLERRLLPRHRRPGPRAGRRRARRPGHLHRRRAGLRKATRRARSHGRRRRHPRRGAHHGRCGGPAHVGAAVGHRPHGVPGRPHPGRHRRAALPCSPAAASRPAQHSGLRRTAWGPPSVR